MTPYGAGRFHPSFPARTLSGGWYADYKRLHVDTWPDAHARLHSSQVAPCRLLLAQSPSGCCPVSSRLLSGRVLSHRRRLLVPRCAGLLSGPVVCWPPSGLTWKSQAQSARLRILTIAGPRCLAARPRVCPPALLVPMPGCAAHFVCMPRCASRAASGR